jgi:hypothetical protein
MNLLIQGVTGAAHSSNEVHTPVTVKRFAQSADMDIDCPRFNKYIAACRKISPGLAPADSAIFILHSDDDGRSVAHYAKRCANGVFNRFAVNLSFN